MEMCQDCIDEWSIDDEDDWVEPEYLYHIFKIRDDVDKSIEELDDIFNAEELEDFVEMYCEEA